MHYRLIFWEFVQCAQKPSPQKRHEKIKRTGVEQNLHECRLDWQQSSPIPRRRLAGRFQRLSGCRHHFAELASHECTHNSSSRVALHEDRFTSLLFLIVPPFGTIPVSDDAIGLMMQSSDQNHLRAFRTSIPGRWKAGFSSLLSRDLFERSEISCRRK